MQALLGHTYVDTTARYIHLAPMHVKLNMMLPSG